MSLQYGVPVPKPEPMRRTKARKDREDAKLLKAFREAVWAREAVGDPIYGWGRCQFCLVTVDRDGNNFIGEVHHRIGRRAKATRYDPANGVLLCGGPNGFHGKAQRHEITI